MSDKYVVFQNFRWGLEGRKSELTSQPGALLQCINAHINAGGEIEQRKSFVKNGVVFPDFTFGLEATDSGLVTFGSRPKSVKTATRQRTSGSAFIDTSQSPVDGQLVNGDTVIISGVGGVGYNGTFPIVLLTGTGFIYNSPGVDEGTTVDTGGTVATVMTFPTGITYQPLQHPTGWWDQGGGFFAPAIMTKVLFSCVFKGKALVIAEYCDGFSFLYYDGAIVLDSRNGMVLAFQSGAESISLLSMDLATQIQLLQFWNATANKGALPWSGGNEGSYSKNTFDLAGSTLIETPPGIRLGIVPETTSAAAIGAQLIDQDFPGISAKSANVAITLNVGTNGTITVTAPKNSDGTQVAQLSGGAVNFITDLPTTATALCAAINANTFIHGYTAAAVNSTVSVYAPSEWGNVTFNLTTVTTGDITVVQGVVGQQAAPVQTYFLKLTPASLSIKKSFASPDQRHPVAGTVSGTIQASVAGANTTSSTSYAWAESYPFGQSPSGIALSSDSGASVTFSKYLAPGTSVSGTFVCVATDKLNQAPNDKSTVHFSVTLTNSG